MLQVIGWPHVALVLVLLTAACAPTTPPRPPASGDPGGTALPAADGDGAANQNRTLVVAVGRAPESLGAKPLRSLSGPGNPQSAVRAFNAGLVLHDDREDPRPYLAEALPQLNTDSWRVFPDGRMETTYRLKPDLAWHDGTALSAEDFVFAWKVYAIPELGVANARPIGFIDEVRAPDPRTVVISWSRLFGDADDLLFSDLPPLPRHLLEAAFTELSPDAMVAHPYWLTDYVGTGPYRLSRYELGVALEGQAFPGHVLGRARIERIRFVFVNDPNTAVSNLLAGSVSIAIDNSVPQQQALFLQREWAVGGSGIVLSSPAAVRGSHFQLRPEFSNPTAILDVRVRKAVAYSTDRQSIADAVTEGQGQAADGYLLPQAPFFAEADRVTTKYPYDLRRAEQLFNEAGFLRGPDGLYSSPTLGRFSLQIATTDANVTEATVQVDLLRQAHIDSSLRVIPRAESANDPLAFHTYSGILNGMFNEAFLPPILRFRASAIPRPETRFMGSNFPGFNHPEFERLVAAYEGTLSRAERNRHAVEMARLLSEEMPGYPLVYFLAFVPHTASLRGPMPTASTRTASWNVHEWYWVK
jgi:peptide/nickel transport system substrate-binding protein